MLNITKLVAMALILISPVAANAQSASEERCLAEAIYYESRGEPLRGKIAVGNVVLNRMESKAFPQTVCGVVYQRSQFSWTRGRRQTPSGYQWIVSQKVANELLNGVHEDNTGGAKYFYASSIRAPKWARRGMTAKIGGHIFIR